ncbi:MAG TPA: MarC family protein [Dissulfurispiraceae bacterium]
MDIIGSFFPTIIPLMVAIDAPGVLPIYLTITEGLEIKERKKVVRESVLTAFIITVVFVYLGAAVFRILGIMVEDFMIAGGVLLLVISVNDMLHAGTPRMSASPSLGVVPLGTPLLAGPATMTTSLALVGTYGYTPVLLSLVLNLLLAWLILDRADAIIKLIGMNGARGTARVASLLLAAIAVKLIRTGIFRLTGH